MRPAFYDNLQYRRNQSERTKEKWLAGDYNGHISSLQERTCFNSLCRATFKVKSYDPKKYCSRACAAIRNNHLRVQSASTRHKISTKLKNYPNVFNLLAIRWEYAPTVFDLGEHTYRPDFYLPDDTMYIEVKNFMSPYSLKRDSLFREKYPTVSLRVLSKDEYKQIESEYKALIEKWE